MFRRKKPQEPSPPQVRILDLKPGDILVLSSSKPLTQKVIEQLRADLNKNWPNQKLMILDESFTLTIAKNDTEGATSDD